mmetsp:Transcript_59499/g.170779  ORF Transcript_59499/g.170779 Transcript_59499/m.170779 type:complete len:392 (-) Transcript_59499:134-1309(-)
MARIGRTTAGILGRRARRRGRTMPIGFGGPGLARGRTESDLGIISLRLLHRSTRSHGRAACDLVMISPRRLHRRIGCHGRAAQAPSNFGMISLRLLHRRIACHGRAAMLVSKWGLMVCTSRPPRSPKPKHRHEDPNKLVRIFLAMTRKRLKEGHLKTLREHGPFRVIEWVAENCTPASYQQHRRQHGSTAPAIPEEAVALAGRSTLETWTHRQSLDRRRYFQAHRRGSDSVEVEFPPGGPDEVFDWDVQVHAAEAAHEAEEQQHESAHPTAAGTAVGSEATQADAGEDADAGTDTKGSAGGACPAVEAAAVKISANCNSWGSSSHGRPSVRCLAGSQRVVPLVGAAARRNRDPRLDGRRLKSCRRHLWHRGRVHPGTNVRVAVLRDLPSLF